MGQRHQIFIKVNNPLKLKRSYASKEDITKARKIFGSGKYTTIAIHHQWLYGRSAIFNIGHILNITKNMNDYNNPFSDDYSFNSLDEYIKHVMMLLQVQTNPLHPRGIGIERMHFLNTDCIDDDGKYSRGWDMRLDFRNGDNNDGISIIDTIERKYCLINIFNQYIGENNVSGLPSMLPSSAEDYAHCYYSDKAEIRDNILACLPLKDYSLLSIKEVSKMFPKMQLQKELA
jgi:hypothetical protein